MKRRTWVIRHSPVVIRRLSFVGGTGLRFTIVISLIVMSFIFISCSESILGPDPANTPESNFEVLSQDFKNVYPFFEKKNVNWDSLNTFYRLKVNSNTTDIQLFKVMSQMLGSLKDGHIRLTAPCGTFHYEDFYKYPHNFPGFDIIQQNYLKSTKVSAKFIYGQLANETGYIYIPVFESSAGSQGFEYIDQILDEFKGLKAIIIDIRDNYGGEIDNAKTVASRFADRKHLYVYSRWKNSSRPGDFSEYLPENIEPGGKTQFLKPVVILTNRQCYSSAEHFIFAMKTFPNVTVMGDTTGGVMGIPVYRELPNGWKYMLPRSIQYDQEKVCYEGQGIPPDIQVSISENDLNAGKDAILERAIGYLSNKQVKN